MEKKNLLFLPAAFLALMMFSLICSSSFAQVTIYKDSRFRGSSKDLGNDMVNLSHYGFNDEISSMKVKAGYKATCYFDKGFTGRKVVLFHGDYPEMGNGWNDEITSVKIERLSGDEIVPSVILYNDIFSGACQRLGLGEFNTDVLLDNDVFSSIEVPTGVKVTLFADKGFGGRSIYLEEGRHILPDWNFNDDLSSIKILLKNYKLIKIRLVEDPGFSDNIQTAEKFVAATGMATNNGSVQNSVNISATWQKEETYAHSWTSMATVGFSITNTVEAGVEIEGLGKASRSLSTTLSTEFSISRQSSETETSSESTTLGATQNCPAKTTCTATFFAYPTKKKYRVFYTYREVDEKGEVIENGSTKTREAELIVESAINADIVFDEIAAK